MQLLLQSRKLQTVSVQTDFPGMQMHAGIFCPKIYNSFKK